MCEFLKICEMKREKQQNACTRVQTIKNGFFQVYK
jgi:hypothetical protein